MSRSTHAKWLNGREKREGNVHILLVKWHPIGVSLSEIYDKSVKSRDQDQTAPMFWLILLYIFPLRECMVDPISPGLRVDFSRGRFLNRTISLDSKNSAE